MSVRKSASCQMYEHNVNSSCSDASVSSSSSSENSDTPLKRFNRLLRSSVARHWGYFRKDGPGLRTRGRSVSDAGLCSIVDHDPELEYLAIPVVSPRLSLQVHKALRATISISTDESSSGGSTGAGAAAAADESDSDADRPRRTQHLRVPTPAFVGQSTGNFASGAAGGGCGAPRSAPATPLQLEPHPRKHDKHAVKPLSGSAPSVRADTADEAADGKQPSKSRQKKFQRHFPQVGPEERVLNYYSCALVGDLLLQGHLYITKNYFAFYSNVFGYVTKLLIPITSVLRITKEKVARIIPNAVGVCTRDERHVFGSLLSRDSTYKLMTHVWKASRAPETVPKPQVSEVELDASEYSPEDESSSGGAEPVPAPVATPAKRDSDAIMPVSAVIQPSLLIGAPLPGARRGGAWRALLLLAVALLAATAAALGYRLLAGGGEVSQNEFASLSGDEMYSEVVRWRARLHGRAAAELHAFLTTNLLLLTKVRQSLEALSGVILTDMAHNHGPIVDVPNETAFS